MRFSITNKKQNKYVNSLTIVIPALGRDQISGDLRRFLPNISDHAKICPSEIETSCASGEHSPV